MEDDNDAPGPKGRTRGIEPSADLPDAPREDGLPHHGEQIIVFPRTPDSESGAPIKKRITSVLSGLTRGRAPNNDEPKFDGHGPGSSDRQRGYELAPTTGARRGGDKDTDPANAPPRMPELGDDRGSTGESNALPVKIDDQSVVTHQVPPEEDLPAFVTQANPRLWRNTERSLDYVGEVTTLYRDVFTPTRPKRTVDEFVGRRGTIERIIQAVEEERAHVALYGHQGLGKTSVLNVISEFARRAGYLVARVTGTTDLTFATLIRVIFEELSDSVAETPAGDVFVKQLHVQQLTDLVGDETHDVPGAIKALDPLAGHQIIVCIDDVHRVIDPGVKRKLKELMTAVSDKGAWVQFVIADRPDESDEVTPEESSASRTNVSLALDLMGPSDIEEIVTRGSERLGLHFDEDVLEAMVQLSGGLPAVTQWLGLLTARRAFHQYSERVTLEDLVAVTDEAARKMSPRLNALLDLTQEANRTAKIDDVLFLAAQTPLHEDGVFSASDMSHAAPHVVGRPWPTLNLHRILSHLCVAESDPVLEKVSSAQGPLYRFVNPAMRALIMLRNARRLSTVQDELLPAPQYDQTTPEPESSEPDDFELWLRFVLTQEEAAQFRRWSDQDEAGRRDLLDRFCVAQDDGELEALLQHVRTVLDGSPHDDAGDGPGVWSSR